MKVLFFILAFAVLAFPQVTLNPSPTDPVNIFDPTNENIVQPSEVFIVYRNPRTTSDTMSLHIKNCPAPNSGTNA
jgi:hypothetical protein